MNADGPAKLFVGQIPKTSSESEIQPLFEAYGNIVEFSIIRDKATRTSKGCAFLTYTKRLEAEACIAALHNTYTIPGMPSPLQIKYAGTANQEREGENKLFIGMIPKTSVESDLTPIFAPFGEIHELTILRGADQMSKGCAFLRYKNIESATAAIGALNGTFKMPGSPANLVVKFAESEKQRSQKAQQINPLANLGAMNMGNQVFAQPYWDPYAQLSAASALSPYASYGNPALDNAALTSGLYAGSNFASGLSPYAAYANPTVDANAANMAALQALYYPFLNAAQPAPAMGLGSNKEGPPGANLFVYHLPKEYTDSDLLTMFSPYGGIESCKVITDKETGLSRCYGFVSYQSPESANLAISQLNGFQVSGKRLKVEVKTPRGAVVGFKPY